MAFKVPERHRLRAAGLWSSSELDGNNGAFQFLHQGIDFRCIASDGGGWEHVSVTLDRPRTPTWEQMCFIKSLFWGPEDCVVQYHPAEADYVNNHPHCLHLWRPIDGRFPTPPTFMIGVKL